MSTTPPPSPSTTSRTRPRAGAHTEKVRWAVIGLPDNRATGQVGEQLVRRSGAGVLTAGEEVGPPTVGEV